MVIAYLLGRYPTFSNTFVYREIDALRSHGVCVDVYGLSRTEEPNHDILGDAPIRWVPTAHAVVLADSISTALLREWSAVGGRKKDLRRARWLARQWRRSGVTCVHTHFLGFSSALASVACSIANIPLVVTVHARGILVPDHLAPFTLSRANSLISISQTTNRIVRSKTGCTTTVIPLPVAEGERSPPSTDAFQILSVGRSVPKKGYSTLREAFTLLETPASWTVAGADEVELGGPLEGLNALGAVSFQTIESVYRKGVDVFALACCEGPDGDADGVPVAMMEAMARGVAVVATQVGAISELITDGETGLLVPPDDPLAMARALERLAGDHQLRKRLAENGRAHVLETRSKEPHTQALVGHFRQLS